jgi:hypothetical protein
MKYIYAEQLQGKRVTLTIDRVQGGIDFTDTTGRKNKGLDVYFVGKTKCLGLVGTTIRRQFIAALGDDLNQWPGKRIVLFPVPSAKAVTGQAIRAAAAQEVSA